DDGQFREYFTGIRSFLPIRDALNRTHWSEVQSTDFSAPPTATRLDTIRRFAIFGFDFKITPKHEIKLIEINGSRSGMDGFARSHLEAESLDGVVRADRALNRTLATYGKRERALIGTFMLLQGQESYRFGPVRDLFDESLALTLGIGRREAWVNV